jgi:hypothetical protein
MAGFDIKKLSTNELGFVGGAAVAFLGLFFHAYKVTFNGQGIGFAGGTLAGWHFKGLWFPVLLLVAAAALVVVKRMNLTTVPELPATDTMIELGVAAVATLFVLVRVFTYPSASSSDVNAGAAFGSYLVLIAVIVSLVFAVLGFRASGEKLPDFRGSGNP